MPTNVTIDYIKAQERYLAARTREEKMSALEEMIRTCPKHKGCENLLAELKSKLAKMKKLAPKKTGRRSATIAREGDGQICILGVTQSGKSTLLSKLTNAKPKISNVPYTTVKPEIGTMDYHGVKIQLIEIPSTFDNVHMNIAQASDGIILIYKDSKELELLENIMKKHWISKPVIKVKKGSNLDSVRDEMWKILKLIKVYCKEPGKKPEQKPMVLRKGATVGDAASDLHKDFEKFFKFARVWGKSAKHQGQTVGKDHRLEDEDVIEIHI